MSTIDPNLKRSAFFPGQRTNSAKQSALVKSPYLKRNDESRAQELKKSVGQDVNVKIPQAVKDFSRIKKSVDLGPEVDNSKKIAELKAQIQSGKYKVDYEQLADKILQEQL